MATLRLFKYYAVALLSMLRDSSRVEGRPWLGELVARALKIILTAPEHTSLPRLRSLIEAAAVAHPSRLKVAIDNIQVAGVPCLKVAAKNPTPVVIVYLHGGGYVFGSPKGHQGLLTQLAANSHATLVAVDYRLSPEHPFPAAQEDCLKVASALFNEFPDHKKILAGDSAGGALAVATALSLNTLDVPQPADACVLISPWVDPWAQGGSMLSNAETDFLTLEWLSKSIELHMGGAQPDHRVKVLSADLKDLPETLVQSGAAEVFHDQICDFVAHAKRSNVSVNHEVDEAQFHVYQLLSPIMKDASNAVARIANFINRLATN